jgi:hypothetical protein
LRFVYVDELAADIRISSGTAAAIYHLSGRQRKSKVAPQNSRYVP